MRDTVVFGLVFLVQFTRCSATKKVAPQELGWQISKNKAKFIVVWQGYNMFYASCQRLRANPFRVFALVQMGMTEHSR